MQSKKDTNILDRKPELGSLHPVNNTKNQILDFLSKQGFEISEGPEIETEEFNFDMLNIKENHPARQMHDTFYLNDKDYLLRTHTSPVQVRCMLEKNLQWLLYQEERFLEKMMIRHTYLCSIKSKEFI